MRIVRLTQITSIRAMHNITTRYRQGQRHTNDKLDSAEGTHNSIPTSLPLSIMPFSICATLSRPLNFLMYADLLFTGSVPSVGSSRKGWNSISKSRAGWVVLVRAMARWILRRPM